jgi:ATP-dependent helicase HepA
LRPKRVDEAHHLEWSLESSSPEYDAVEAIAKGSAGLLLLTATPEQLGREGHFARLRLLDPARFSDLDEFVRESEKYRSISELADRLRGEEKLKAKDLKAIGTLLGKETAERLKEDATPARRDAARVALIDLHGPGRVLFRNRRLVLDTFPKRVAQLVEASAQRIGLKRVDPRKGNKPETNSRETDAKETEVAGITQVSPQPSEVSPLSGS